MTRFCQFLLGLALALACSARAQNAPIRPGGSVDANQAPPTAAARCPVGFFRQLLAMSPAELTKSLTNRAPDARARILEKVGEYQGLAPDERELRLRATEVRWWLTPLLRMAPSDRAARLAQVPTELRPLLQTRLDQWNILPPPLRDEFLANDEALHYFARIEDPAHPAGAADQKKIAEQFNHFFELTPEEKQQTLTALSAAEREQIEETLQTFDHLPPEQRQICVRNYARFAGMSEGERAKFLKDAERWSKMSPEERQAWRDLVQQVPIWPAGWTPNPPPPLPPGFASPTVATNRN